MTRMPADVSLIDSRHAARRLAAALCIVTLGSSGMYILPVVMPAVQQEFSASRAGISLAYTVTMVASGVGGMLCGRAADRYGLAAVVALGALGVAAGYVLAGLSSNIILFVLAHGMLIGLLGIASAFVPLMADTALWWNRRRGIAVAICASGNYVAGTVWPPLVQWGVEHVGWRHTYTVLGLSCGAGMAALCMALRKRPPLPLAAATASAGGHAVHDTRPFGLPAGLAQMLLFIASVSCCVAMSMPQVHIVSYCTDLGINPARGAEMLSRMLGFGIVSRLASGWIADHLGGMRTLILGSALQTLALLLFLPFDGLVTLYIISAMFGLFQGGIVPSYAIVVREYFPPREAGARVGSVMFGTLLGMALGGWMSGKIFDLTGSYRMAFINGVGWNLFNLALVSWLFMRAHRQRASA
ncbi:MFS transporter [Noviherbaspirillum denitrificans]|uniref:MFS transporter n=1 Tax=Noviherbaspirillum denitrificans TaxID=1968433 RepID=A0A254TH44_9BURK|nr:MFS transporter [Noviherbaspirillum denitrificans]OWW21960.1 MFS transporter [Noviherbaspirillum denitrificans]